jgi:hypothetical protein
MKQALWIIPNECEVELTFTTNPDDAINCVSDIWGRGLAECWVEFPEFLLKACKGFQQTPKGEQFLILLASIIGERFDPEVVYWTIGTHQTNPIKLTASRREICSTFGLCEINNRYIKAISVPKGYVCEDEEDIYKWFIIVNHDSFSDTISKIIFLILTTVEDFINEALAEICQICRNLILFIANLIQKFIDCLLVLLLLILAIFGGLIMRLDDRTPTRDRTNRQSRFFGLFPDILDYLRKILGKLNTLDEININLTKLDEKVDSLSLNFNSSSEINMQNLNDINYKHLEELIRENERLRLINDELQEKAEIRERIINRQKDYIENSVKEIEQASKIMSLKEGDKGKLSVEDIGELCSFFNEIREKAGTVINQTNNDLRESRLEGIINIGSKNRGKQTGVKNKPQQPPQKNQEK